jgi:dinuclear metal center YbgI/SA1388 family protein
VVSVAGRDELISFCDELLEVGRFDDYGPNGLQVPGATEVTKLVSGVTANRRFLELAAASGAEMVLVHHGLFFGDGPRALSESMAGRLRVVLGAQISVAAYHLPLDAHPEIGNNALLCAELGMDPDQRRFAEVKGTPIGIIGRDAVGIDAAELVRRVATLLEREPLVFDFGPQTVRSVGIVSGAGAGTIAEAAALGLDALITGEPAEHAMGEAEEAGLHFIAAGHYATERLGIRRLGELLADRFDVDHEFVDVPNPV